MNILEQEDMVKGLPDQILIQQAQMPTGEIPQFLVVSELDRRQKMRKSFAERVPEETVTDQVISQGIAAMNPNPDPLMATAMGAQPPQDPMMGQQMQQQMQQQIAGQDPMMQPPMMGQDPMMMTPQDPMMQPPMDQQMMPPQDPMMMAAGGGMMPYRMQAGRGTSQALERALAAGLSQENLNALLGEVAKMRYMTPEEYSELLSVAQSGGFDVSEFAGLLDPAPDFSGKREAASYIPYGSEFDQEPVDFSLPGSDNPVMQQFLGVNTDNQLGSRVDELISSVDLSEQAPPVIPEAVARIAGGYFDDKDAGARGAVIDPRMVASSAPRQGREALLAGINTATAAPDNSNAALDAMVNTMNRRQELLDKYASNAIKEDTGRVTPEDQTEELVEMANAPDTTGQRVADASTADQLSSFPLLPTYAATFDPTMSPFIQATKRDNRPEEILNEIQKLKGEAGSMDREDFIAQSLALSNIDANAPIPRRRETTYEDDVAQMQRQKIESELGNVSEASVDLSTPIFPKGSQGIGPFQYGTGLPRANLEAELSTIDYRIEETKKLQIGRAHV